MGPLLFTRDLRRVDKIFEKHVVEYVIYIDDTQAKISAHPPELSNAIPRLVQYNLEVKTWLLAYKVKMNDFKTRIIMLGNRPLLQQYSLSSVLIGHCEVEMSNCEIDACINR
jgi:hypothetical protein